MGHDVVAFLWLVPALCVVAFFAWRRRRDQAGKIPHETIQLLVPSSLYRGVQNPIVFYAISVLTGVSITFSPMYLFLLGSSGARPFDWRVIVCGVVTYVIPGVYMRFGGLVLAHAWKARNAMG